MKDVRGKEIQIGDTVAVSGQGKIYVGTVLSVRDEPTAKWFREHLETARRNNTWGAGYAQGRLDRQREFPNEFATCRIMRENGRPISITGGERLIVI